MSYSAVSSAEATSVEASSSVIRSVVYTSVTQIPKLDWDSLWTDTGEGYAYYLTLEAAQLSGFIYRYIICYSDDRVALLAPLFSADLDLAMAVEGLAQRLVHFARRFVPRFLVQKTLFCGSPFGENGVIGITPEVRLHERLIKSLADAMDELCRSEGLSFMMFKDFRGDGRPDLALLVGLGYMKGDSYPNVSVSLPYRTFDEYLLSLSSNARKDLRRKLRQTRAAGEIEVRVVRDVAEVMDDLYTLYLDSYLAGTVRFEKLTKEYFLAVAEHMGDSARFFLYYISGKLVAFNLCFIDGKKLIDKFVGFDPDVVRKFNLYFYTWYNNVEWCIEQGFAEYQVGQTDCDEKVRLGGRMIPLYFYARHRNAAINFVLRSFARVLMPRS